MKLRIRYVQGYEAGEAGTRDSRALTTMLYKCQVKEIFCLLIKLPVQKS